MAPSSDEKRPERERSTPRRETHTGDRSRWRFVRDHLRGAFIENAALKFVAFVLALTVFILVQSDEDVYIGVDVGLSYVLPEDRVLVSERPDSVRITVKGSRRQTRRFSEKDIDRIPLDLRAHRTSEYVFREDVLPIPDGLELVRFSPESFQTKFERVIEKTLPVDARTSGTPRVGYSVSQLSTDPREVVIRGAESQVMQTKAVTTAEVRLADRHEAFTATVELVAPGDLVDIVDVQEVRVEVKLVEEQGSRAVGPLAIKMRPGPDSTQENADRFVAEPAIVNLTLRGHSPDIKAVDARTLEAYVEIYNEDVAMGRTRRAPVLVHAPDKIALEITPREVTIHPKQVK
jgi:YbbR domain-containing protein